MEIDAGDRGGGDGIAAVVSFGQIGMFVTLTQHFLDFSVVAKLRQAGDRARQRCGGKGRDVQGGRARRVARRACRVVNS